ncbi:hypothetical protein EDD15DRAFT_2181399 [Pisolithus albus]|nr:hypothetical protein EDD15DRAFT_2181399 [Pisolithus albus]
MRLADEAWNEVNTTTIRNCWRKAGILPDLQLGTARIQPSVPILSLIHSISDSLHHEDPILQAEELVSSALNDLESTGVLQHSNRMDIAELLDPAAETHNLFDATDTDIHDAVMEAKRSCEESAILGMSADDNNEGPVEPSPTCNEALQAVLVLQKYTKSLNDPFARKLELMLGTFGQRTRTKGMQNMKDSKITSYFTSTVQ